MLYGGGAISASHETADSQHLALTSLPARERGSKLHIEAPNRVFQLSNSGFCRVMAFGEGDKLAVSLDHRGDNANRRDAIAEEHRASCGHFDAVSVEEFLALAGHRVCAMRRGVVYSPFPLSQIKLTITKNKPIAIDRSTMINPVLPWAMSAGK